MLRPRCDMNTKYNCDLQTVLLKTLSAQKRLDRERLYTALDDLLIDISPVIMFLSLFFHLAPSSGNTRRHFKWWESRKYKLNWFPLSRLLLKFTSQVQRIFFHFCDNSISTETYFSKVSKEFFLFLKKFLNFLKKIHRNWPARHFIK